MKGLKKRPRNSPKARVRNPNRKADWRANLFIFMSRNAADATSFFNLPADQTIEVGVRLEI
jgi:KUP system potassium uptake protein